MSWSTPLGRDLGPVTRVPPRRDIGSVAGSIMGWRWDTLERTGDQLLEVLWVGDRVPPFMDDRHS